MYKSSDNTAGAFQEVEYGNWFTYKPTKDAWAISVGLLHEIDVLDGVRFGNVVKTRAYVCTDLDSDGNTVMETWKLKKHEHHFHG